MPSSMNIELILNLLFDTTLLTRNFKYFKTDLESNTVTSIDELCDTTPQWNYGR